MEKSEFRILIADDDAMVRDVMVKFLSDQGYVVMTAHDGHDALRLLRLEDIHLVLTDLRMPGADGIEVLRTSLRINPRIMVVILTAYGTLDNALEAVNEGAYDYIAKPFVMQQLLLIVRNAYRMAVLYRENERLSSHLKETYRGTGGAKIPEGEKPSEIKHSSVERIEKLRELNVINEEEARILMEQMKTSDDGIKNYGYLVEKFKKGYQS